MAAEEADRATRSHQGTYSFFVGLMKYGAIASFIAAMIVVIVISS